MKLSEETVIYYYTMATFIIQYFLYEYALEAEDFWGEHAATGMKYFKHWYKISLLQEILFQRDSYTNCVDNEDISSWE